MTDENKIMCEICDKLFTNRKNMYQHVHNVHKVEPNIKGSILCPVEECNLSVITFDKLRSHLEADHFIKIIKEEITFPGKSGKFMFMYSIIKTFRLIIIIYKQ